MRLTIHPGGDGAHGTPVGHVDDGWGTNIHWTSPPGGAAEVAMLAKAFRVARMDLTWAAVEKHPGVYDFAAYDGLMATLQTHGVRPYLILDYGNPLYPPAPVGNCSTPRGCNAS